MKSRSTLTPDDLARLLVPCARCGTKRLKSDMRPVPGPLGKVHWCRPCVRAMVREQSETPGRQRKRKPATGGRRQIERLRKEEEHG